MSIDIKKIAPPSSTSGAGTVFESQVQASFVVLMLTDSFSPCLQRYPITKIQTQAKHQDYDVRDEKSGHQIDDLIVYAENPDTGKEYKLLGQVKHNLSLTKGDKTFRDVIVAAWIDFNNQKIFDPEKDAIALITGPLSTTDLEARDVLEMARSSLDEDDFLRKMTIPGFVSDRKRDKLEAFRKHLKFANGDSEVPDDALWRFLKVFHLLIYDLDIESGVNLALLHSLIGQYHRQGEKAVWAQLVEKVQTTGKTAGVITRDSIPQEIREAFSKPIVEKMPEVLAKPDSHIDWNAIEYAADLAIALLIGSWNENNNADKKIVEEISSESYGEWIKKLREVQTLQDSPIQQKSGVWAFSDRLALWDSLATRLYDEHLDKFQNAAIQVLSEIDPQFELEPEERYAAAIHNKVLQHSQNLRKGLADGLALVSSHQDVLQNCSLDKGVAVAFDAVRKILSSSDWLLWGSTKDVQPALAEAAPKEFIKAVENAIDQEENPFDILFSQEGRGGLGGTNYMTGLLWALEGLAWHPDYLTSVVVVLGELDSYDPGGNWANRPANSIIDIFLPWLPHTTAPFEKRKMAFEALVRELPESAWKVLIQLLPNQSRSTSGTYKPEWQAFIPDDWKKEVTNKEYWDQCEYYSELFVELAGKNPSKLSELVEHIDHLTKSSFNKAIGLLEKTASDNRDSEDSYQIWKTLTSVVIKHKKFSDAKWALPKEETARFEDLAKKLQPQSKEKLYLRLFTHKTTDLFESKGNWREQERQLQERRKDAANEIFQQSGYKGIKNFSLSVDAPDVLGSAFGATIGGDEDVSEVQKLLNSNVSKIQQLASGYAWSRYYDIGDEWINQINIRNCEKEAIAKLLISIPFQMQTWRFVEELLGEEHEYLYWKKVNVMPYYDMENMYHAIDKLLTYQRPLSAVEYLDRLLHEKKELDVGCAVKALLMAVTTEEPSRAMDSYSITNIIKHLQERKDVLDDDRFKIEWAYLPLLNRLSGGETTPKYLEGRLSSDPEFFCEVLRLIFRSKHDEKEAEVSEFNKNIATNAYRLLHDWQTPPGLQSDGKFSAENFTNWLDTVIELCTKSGHLEVALSQIGGVLIHVPAEEDGLWIQQSVAEALNRRELEGLRNGYRIGVYNSRGVHWVDPEAKPELELAAKYRQYAEDIDAKGLHRFATTLRELADGYDREAKRIISTHKKD